MNLYLDIETIPTQRADLAKEIAESVEYKEPQCPGNISKLETKQKWLDEKYPELVKKAKSDHLEEIDQKYRETALNGTVGEIICISWAIDDNPVKRVIRSLEQDESTILIQLNGSLHNELKDSHGYERRPVWIGHNITGFDLRFLWQRFVINNIKPMINIPYDAKPWDDCVFDTRTQWCGVQKYSKGFHSLDFLCKVFNIKQKGDLDGSKVWDYVKEGRYEEIGEYCDDDVERVRELHNRMRFR